MLRKLFRGDRCTFPHGHLIYTVLAPIFVAELIKLMSAGASHISVEPGSEAFPLLTPAQIERLRPHGKLRHVEAGEVLFEPGDSNVPVYVVLSGGLEILQPCPEGVRSVVKHVPGSITGEFTVISGQRALLRGQVIASGEFLQIASGEFRALVAKDAELAIS